LKALENKVGDGEKDSGKPRERFCALIFFFLVLIFFVFEVLLNNAALMTD